MGKRTPGRRFALEQGGAVVMALGLDMLGEPPAAWHPVVWFGKIIHALERGAPRRHLHQLLYGGVILVLAAPSAYLPAAVVHLIAKRAYTQARQRGFFCSSSLLYALIEGAGLKPCFAWRMLVEDGRSVRQALEGSDLPAAREALRNLVSRDRTGLSEEQVAAAAIESLAESQQFHRRAAVLLRAVRPAWRGSVSLCEHV